MHYLVTGGLGVMGSLFARELLLRGYDVTVLDPGGAPRHTTNLIGIHQALGEPTCGRLEVVEGSTDEDMGLMYGYRFDKIIHAGASTGIPYSAESPDEDWNLNVDGTYEFLRWLRNQSNPPPTVILSSVKPYAVQENVPLTGQEPLEPDEPYAASKAAQSMLAMAWGRSYGLPVLTLRCSNLWGPAACHGPRHGWLTWFCIQAGLGRELEVQGTGNQARDMLWWTDVLNAVDKGHSSLEMGLVQPGDILTIGGGVKHMASVGQAARKLQAMTGCSIREAPEKRREHEDEWVCVDNTAADRAFKPLGGFDPLTGVEEGMRLLVEWAKEHKGELEAVYG